MKFLKLFLIILLCIFSLGSITADLQFTDFKCINAIDEIENNNVMCTKLNWVTYEEEEMRKLCDLIDTSKCQKYYKTKIIDIPECKTSDKLQLLELIRLEYVMSDKYITLTQECSRDERGNFCPLSSINMDKKNIGNNDNRTTKKKL